LNEFLSRIGESGADQGDDQGGDPFGNPQVAEEITAGAAIDQCVEAQYNPRKLRSNKQKA
jgi:hypothetical protein